MHVLVGIPVLLVGGTEVQTLALVRALKEGGHEVTVCCYFEYNEGIANLFRQEGAKVLLLGLKRSSRTFDPRALSRLAKAWAGTLRQVKPDILHIQYVAPALLPIGVARWSWRGPILATVHIAGSRGYGAKARAMLSLASRFCELFFCDSLGTEAFWFGGSRVLDRGIPRKDLLLRKHWTVYCAMDVPRVDRFADRFGKNALRREQGWGPGPMAVCVGRLAPQKGLIYLIKALPAILRKAPDFRLVIIGEGNERLGLEAACKGLGVVGAVTFLGAIPQEEVFRLLPAFDLLVAPSLFEGFGFMAAEAMAAGLPVVGSEVEGLSEVVLHGETGVLCGAADSIALGEAVLKLLADPARMREMGARGRDRILENFSYERFRDVTLHAYSVFEQ